MIKTRNLVELCRRLSKFTFIEEPTEIADRTKLQQNYNPEHGFYFNEYVKFEYKHGLDISLQRIARERGDLNIGFGPVFIMEMNLSIMFFHMMDIAD